MITLAIRAFVFALDIGREQNVAQALDVTLGCIAVPAHQQHSLKANLAPRKNFRLEFPRAKKNSFSNWQFPSRPDPSFPGVGRDLPRQKNFYDPGQVFASGGARRQLRVNSSPLAKKASWNDAGVV